MQESLAISSYVLFRKGLMPRLHAPGAFLYDAGDPTSEPDNMKHPLSLLIPCKLIPA